MRMRGGFTLVEIVITLGLFAVLFGLGLFVSMGSYRGVLDHSEVDTVATLLQSARESAMNNRFQSPWGLCYDASVPQYLLFSGASETGSAHTDALPAQNDIVVIGLPACEVGGIIFTQLSGTTTATEIVLAQGARTSTISINDEGRIDF